MKKLFYVMLIAVATIPAQCDAQSSLKNILGNILSSSSNKSTTGTDTKNTTSADVLSSIFNNVVGTKSISKNNIVGTWTYSEPAVAFSSKNLLSQAGGVIAANTVEKKLGSALTKYGFTSGTSTFIFAADSTFTAKLKNKAVTGKYSISGSTVTFYSKLGVKMATANAAIKSNALQLTFKADKLLSFAQYASTVSANSTLTTISKLAKNYDGMQLGMQFSKK